MVETPRLRQHVLLKGPPEGVPVLFVHGNASSSTFWEETMLALPGGYQAIAPDLRGYGDTEDQPVDASRGCRDWVDDLLALMDVLGHSRFHLVGHSLGGSVVWALLAVAPERVLTATVVAPGSPFGFGGTKDLQGRPCASDFAGSGAGLVNPEFARLMAEGYRGEDHPAAPRVVMNRFYWKPPFRHPREEALLSGVLSEKVGPNKYPGDALPSPYWPGVAPGRWGPANALSPKYVGDTVERMLRSPSKPPVLWVRGADDEIVSDASLFEPGNLGRLGVVPGWPGAEVYPPQPMVGQTRYVLERYSAAGGFYQEEVFPDTGHSPHIERPAWFGRLLHTHLQRVG
ncbi:alpha/beta hydrolase [Meiothermus luteus]|jgi:pimeloyl-ACP methyl ester carboxylesterase|nr:alpha/beta hydrolase [Meiothermus luteus]